MIKINFSSLLISTIFIGLFIYSSTQQAGLCRKRNKANGGLFEHEEYCDYYWRCDSRKGQPYLQACPNGLAFAGKGRGLYEYCGYPHVLTKSNVLKTCDENRYQAQEPVSSENCPYSYGIFPHKTSCSKYWQCWNNTASEQKCGFQLLYNEELASCDYPSNVKGCQKHPVCKEVPNGPVLLKGSCILYWQCVGGYPRLERCPAGLAVDPKTLKCELATKVEGCADKVTTPKYEESEDANEKKKKEIVARVVAAAKESKQSKNQKELKNSKEIKVQNQKPKVPKENKKVVKEARNQKEVKNQSQKEVKSHSQNETKSQSQKEVNSRKKSKDQKEVSTTKEVTTAKEGKKKKKKKATETGLIFF